MQFCGVSALLKKERDFVSYQLSFCLTFNFFCFELLQDAILCETWLEIYIRFRSNISIFFLCSKGMPQTKCTMGCVPRSDISCFLLKKNNGIPKTDIKNQISPGCVPKGSRHIKLKTISWSSKNISKRFTSTPPSPLVILQMEQTTPACHTIPIDKVGNPHIHQPCPREPRAGTSGRYSAGRRWTRNGHRHGSSHERRVGLAKLSGSSGKNCASPDHG